MNDMQPLMNRRRGILILLGMAGLFLAARKAAISYFYAPLTECGQPCPAGIDCSPLEIDLFIKHQRLTPAQRGASIWYRLELKNQTCLTLSGTGRGLAWDFHGLPDSSATIGLWLEVVGPDGKRLKKNDRPRSGTLWPYADDPAEYAEARRDGTLTPGHAFKLQPGRALATLSTILHPRRVEVTDQVDERGDRYTVLRQVPAKASAVFAPPPKGYKPLDFYDFATPGSYTITAGYKLDQEHLGDLVFPRWRDDSPIHQTLARLLIFDPPVRAISVPSINIRSKPVHLEIAK